MGPSVSELESIAKTICNIDLNHYTIGYDKNRGFFQSESVASKGRCWSWFSCFSCCFSRKDKTAVSQLENFLIHYNGPLKERVQLQLDSLRESIEGRPTPSKVKMGLSTDQQILHYVSMDFKESMQQDKKSKSSEKRDYVELFCEGSMSPDFTHMACLSPNERICSVKSLSFYPHTAVIKVKRDADFFHANFVKLQNKDYIATVYPFLLKEIFWQTCLKHSNLIIDLTTFEDINRKDRREKYTVYYPLEVGDELEIEALRINCVKKTMIDDKYILSNYLVRDGLGKTTTISRIHYTQWFDYQGASQSDIFQLIDLLEKYESSSKIPIVHCIAGMGRTGTFLVCHTLKRLHQDGLLNEENLEKTIKSTIKDGRWYRGHEFVGTPVQLELIFNFGYALLNKSS